MSLINFSVIFIALLNIGLALLVYFRNPKNKINISFSLAVLLLAGWIIGVAMFREAGTETAAWYWTWLQNGFGAYLVVPFFLFSIYFPYQSFVLKTWHKVLIGLSLVAVAYVVVTPGVWVIKINLQPHDNNYDLNILGLIYFNLHFFFYLGFAFYNLFRKYLKSQGVFRGRLLYIIFATGIMAVFGSAFSALYPLVTQTLGPYWLAAYFSLPMIILIIYFIFRKD